MPKSSLQTIELWGHWGAPNPWKVTMILEEIGLPYHMKVHELSEAKSAEYVKINPNGRFPSIHDPNTGITLWESGAIIQYLVDQYDTEHNISHPDLPNKYLTQQWLAFQISGQGPYYGQATWFARFHPEKIQSATDRYTNEIKRVTSVLNTQLKHNATGWLVGDRMSYADLSFVTWCWIADGLFKELGKDDLRVTYPAYGKWLEAMEQSKTIKACQEKISKARQEHGLK